MIDCISLRMVQKTILIAKVYDAARSRLPPIIFNEFVEMS